ncbi:MAG: hypothetical protein JO007_03760 [Alphaproteobacteria bacterium]|nr:hypothetical protein [Alphaproteobacteria bacterium]
MIAKIPVALQWSESAEAERVCAQALLECVPEIVAISSLVEDAAQFRNPPPMLARRLAEWFGLIDLANR